MEPSRARKRLKLTGYDAIVRGFRVDAVELDNVPVTAASQDLGLVFELKKLLDGNDLVTRLPQASVNATVRAASTPFEDLQIVVFDLQVVVQLLAHLSCDHESVAASYSFRRRYVGAVGRAGRRLGRVGDVRGRRGGRVRVTGTRVGGQRGRHVLDRLCQRSQ